MSFAERFFEKLKLHLESPEYRYTDNSPTYYMHGGNGPLAQAAKEEDERYLASTAILSFVEYMEKEGDFIREYPKIFSSLYDLLADDFSKDMLVMVALYRILGHRLVKLPYYTKNNLSLRSELHHKALLADSDPEMDRKLANDEFGIGGRVALYDFEKIGLEGKIYSNSEFLYSSAYAPLYQYRQGGVNIAVEKGDYVFDCGACYGDTSVWFASQAGQEGRVFSFEPHPLISIVQNKNILQNDFSCDVVTTIKKAAWNKAGEKLLFTLSGMGSSSVVELESTNKIQVITTSIDHEVASHNLPRVDFIKMDIEGAEFNALFGAVETLKKYKPRLAISLYHSFEDFYRIPALLEELDLGYKFYLDHHYVNDWETVLYAIVD